MTAAVVVGTLAFSAPLRTILSPQQSPGVSATGSTSRPSAATGGNTSAVCGSATAYHGLDSPDPSHTNASLAFPILSMSAGSSAEICLKFYNDEGVEPVVVDLGEVVSVGNYESRTFPNGTDLLAFVSAAPNVTVTPAQSTLVLGGTSTTPSPGAAGGTLAPSVEVVAFKITAAPTAKGTYYLNIKGASPESCQGDFRLAVGLEFTQTNSSGGYFALPSNAGSCTAGQPVVHDHVSGFEGMDVTYLSCALFICDVTRPSG